MNNIIEILYTQNSRPDLWNDWQWQLKNSVISGTQLLSVFKTKDKDGDIKEVEKKYSTRITPYYLSLIAQEAEHDPVLMQCLPTSEELTENDKFKDDPFEEAENMSMPGVIHRYKDRLVLLVSDMCAMNCRHCTRKNILGNKIGLYADDELQKAFNYIKGEKDVREVLISGGDPFMLETARLDYILSSLSEIEHVEVMRIGTRVPVVLPMRIDDELCQMLARHRPLWINTQFNHPVELTEYAVKASDKLIRVGIPVSNQSVLLKGINDNIDVMRELCLKLQRNMIRPYYVFQCDPVAGAGHFEADISVGIEMEEELRRSVGGLALPRFVADMPNSKGKISLRMLGSKA